MKKTYLSNLTWLALSFLFTTVMTNAQGTLEPTSDPAPSMHSLQEIWNVVEAQKALLDSQGNQIIQLESINNKLRSEVLQLRAGNSKLIESAGIEFPWRTEVVDDTPGRNIGKYASLSFNHEGYPAIAYFDDSGNDLKYAYYDGTEWKNEKVITSGNVGNFSSLAFNQNGHPAICYYKIIDDEGDLMYIESDGKDWSSPVTVDGGPGAGLYCSLAFTPDGRPAISYYIKEYKNLKYAVRNGSNWELTRIDGNGSDDEIGFYTSLAFDDEGFPAIAYYNNTIGDLKYAYKDASGWKVEPVVTVNNSGQFCDLAFNTKGFPTISYRDQTEDALGFAFKNDTGWHRDIINTGDTCTHTSLAYSPSGTATMAYYNEGSKNLEVITINSPIVNKSIVDSDGDVGKFASIGYGPNGQPAIAYWDATHTRLKFVSRKPFSSTH